MPNSIPACGRILHVVGVCINRIGTVQTSNGPFLQSKSSQSLFGGWGLYGRGRLQPYGGPENEACSSAIR